MTLEKMMKWVAVIAIIAGVIRMVMTPMALIYGMNTPPEMWPGFIACALMTIGAFALYLVQAEKIGKLGLIAFLLLTIGNILVTNGAFMTLAGYEPKPELMFINILMMATLVLGSVLFAIVTYRAKVLPRSGAVFMILFVLMMFSPAGDFLPIAWGLSYILLGYGVLKPKAEAKTTSTVVNI